MVYKPKLFTIWPLKKRFADPALKHKFCSLLYIINIEYLIYSTVPGTEEAALNDTEKVPILMVFTIW